MMGQASYMSAPKSLAALSLLDNARIAHRDLEDDIIEVNCRFILHTSSAYWLRQSGVRHGYSVRELIMRIKRSVS
jgi:hypothetical protein